ncbi:hypothetical protein [Phocaeicola dorei]|jgi:hypothetical protein|uniref:hypothetical protein n=1 Tax=Phocaeicola dorei TaxID=357276 RepID=UPI0039B51C34
MKDLKRAIDLITVEKLEKVFSFLKWRELDVLMNGRVRQFVSPDDEYVALIPLVKEFSDYYRVMGETLQSIASFENRSIEALVNRILNPSYDIQKWRIANNYTSDGKIPFFSMTDTIEKIKDVLATAYLDTLNPTRFHKKVYTTDVNRNISEYSFGQTEIGSYILNILCPLGNYQYTIFNPTEQDIPLNRKINMRLLSSIDNIQKDLKNSNNNKVDEDVDQGLYSINFLDSLVDIYDETKDTEMNIIVDWCKDIGFVNEPPISSIKLEPIFMEKVNFIADKYRPKKEENIKKTYYGKIESITANPKVEDREYVQIKIVTIGDDNKKLNIQSRLNYSTFYSIVKIAFDNGSNIKLSGIQKNIGKQKWIDNGILELLDV